MDGIIKIKLKAVETKNTIEKQYSKVLEEKKEFLDAVILCNKEQIAAEAMDYLQALKTFSDMKISNPKYRYEDITIKLDVKNLSIFTILNNDGSGLGIFAKYLFNYINNMEIDVYKAWENHLSKMDSRNWKERN